MQRKGQRNHTSILDVTNCKEALLRLRKKMLSRPKAGQWSVVGLQVFAFEFIFVESCVRLFGRLVLCYTTNRSTHCTALPSTGGLAVVVVLVVTAVAPRKVVENGSRANVQLVHEILNQFLHSIL